MPLSDQQQLLYPDLFLGDLAVADRRFDIIARAESTMGKGPIKMLYILGKDFTGFELEALTDDGAFGLKHWHDFSQGAVVTAHVWPNAAVSMFNPFFHGQVRLFKLADLPAEKDWITSASEGSPS